MVRIELGGTMRTFILFRRCEACFANDLYQTPSAVDQYLDWVADGRSAEQNHSIRLMSAFQAVYSSLLPRT